MTLKEKKYEEIFETLKKLENLKINHNKRKGLVKECYSCLKYIFGFANNLKESIKEAKEKNLEGKLAYSLIEKNLKEYDKNITVNLTERNTT